jgi:DNA-binding MarR family transcriptional regulator
MDSDLVKLISYWEEYNVVSEQPALVDFGKWLREKEGTSATPVLPETGDKALNTGGEVMLLLSRLHKLAKLKTKPLIKKLGFAKDHEYEVLFSVFLLNQPNKKELAKHLILENSTTVEITNRLIKKELLEEWSDETDRRATRLSVTDTGKKKLMESYQELRGLPESFLGGLNETELSQLLDTLKKLETLNQ